VKSSRGENIGVATTTTFECNSETKGGSRGDSKSRTFLQRRGLPGGRLGRRPGRESVRRSDDCEANGNCRKNG